MKLKFFKVLAIFFMAISTTKGAMTISIGGLYDSSSLASYHYGFMQFLYSNPIKDCKTELAITYAKKDLFLNGRINSKSAEIVFLRQGIITDTLILIYNEKKLGMLYSLLRAKIIKIITQERRSTKEIAKQDDYSSEEFYREIKLIGKSKNVKSNEFLPHVYANTIPNVAATSAFAGSIGFKISCDTITDDIMVNEPYLSGHIPYLYYCSKPESIKIFSIDQIPFIYKRNLQSLIFPVESRPGFALSYIALADYNKSLRPLLSIKLYQSALFVMTHLHCSDLQKYHLKKYIYHNLTEINKKLGNVKSEKIFYLTEKVIAEYLKEEGVISSHEFYLNSLKALERKYMLIEKKAEGISQVEKIQSNDEYNTFILDSSSVRGSEIVDSIALNLLMQLESASYLHSRNTSNMLISDSSDCLKVFAGKQDSFSREEYSNFCSEIIFENAFAYRDLISLLFNNEFRKGEIEILKAFAIQRNDQSLIEILRKLENNFSKENFCAIKNIVFQYEVNAFMESR